MIVLIKFMMVEKKEYGHSKEEQVRLKAAIQGLPKVELSYIG